VTHYICTIPAVPLSLNVYTRMKRWEQTAAKHEWQMLVNAAINQKGNACPRGFERVELHAVIQFKTNRGRDGDNYATPLWKWTQDEMVRCHVIPDDTHGRCKAMPPKLVVGPCEQTVVIVKGE
jgi:hypothetical protein